MGNKTGFFIKHTHQLNPKYEGSYDDLMHEIWQKKKENAAPFNHFTHIHAALILYMQVSAL